MSALATSQIEKHFITNEIYKRSKRYFDVMKLNSIQNIDSKLRRVPSQAHKEQIQKKIQNSFMSSNQYFSKKRTDQIQKSKLKSLLLQNFDDPDETQTSCSISTKNYHLNIKKTFDMRKSLPRDFYNSYNHHAGTGLFDSFVDSGFSNSQKRKSIDFDKILGRKDFKQNLTFNHQTKQISSEIISQNSSNRIVNNPENKQIKNISKTYEQLYFDSSNFKCLINLEKQKQAQKRKSLQTNKDNYQNIQISPQNIYKGRAASQKNQSPCCLMFYHGGGKQQFSSLHNRISKNNENYWARQLKVMKKQDFETVKRREEMVEKRLVQIYQRKKIPDVRGQICDSKYFMRNPN